ncbi:MAG: hypothetical protein RSE50_10615 [Myroides sp.]
MNLVELVRYFREGGNYQDFCELQFLDINSEVVEIYMRAPFELENELVFFEIEKTDGNLDFEFKGLMFSNLFDFYFFLDVIEESNNNENRKLSNVDIAKNLFNYAINDA